jgi:uncharacterized membrane protein
MKSFNPYYLLYLIPFGLVAGVIYFVALVWSVMTWYIATIMISLVGLTVFILIRNVLQNFHPKYGIVDHRAEALEMILSTIDNRKGEIKDEEMREIIEKANIISSNPSYRPAERRMKMKALLNKHIKNQKNEE